MLDMWFAIYPVTDFMLRTLFLYLQTAGHRLSIMCICEAANVSSFQKVSNFASMGAIAICRLWLTPFDQTVFVLLNWHSALFAGINHSKPRSCEFGA